MILIFQSDSRYFLLACFESPAHPSGHHSLLLQHVVLLHGLGMSLHAEGFATSWITLYDQAAKLMISDFPVQISILR